MDDARLEAAARRLGENAARRIDPDQVVEQVLGRLRTERPGAASPPRWSPRPWIRVAVAAALVAAAGLGVKHHLDGRMASHTVIALTDGLSQLGTTELTEVMDSLELDAPVAELVVGLDDLSEEQLERLLRRLEG